MSMVSNAVITGGLFSQNIDQRQTQRSAMDRLQEAVAHTALHNAGQRFDPPRCHPNTRIAVLDKIEKWALRNDPYTADASILWLSGPAGAGKSAIAQTLAEQLHSKGLLAASFFFGRSDATRNHSQSLVSTIVYQLYSFVPPIVQSSLLAVIDRDPLIFTKTLLAQFEALIVNPLQPLFESGFWLSIGTRRLIIIDGLDECLDRGMQCNILLMLSESIRQFHVPFIFLLASRPEHDIQARFSSPDFLPIHTRLFLDDTYLPDRDIELFLRDQFRECRTTHPFRHMIPLNWPSDEVVKELTRKSSGQFIYASVVAKYVKCSRHRPHHRLDTILNLRPASRDLPFFELDALYTHIFSGIDDIESVLNILSFHITSPNMAPDIVAIERILRLDVGEVSVRLCDLASIIGNVKAQCRYNPRVDRQTYLKIHHASVPDYLLDGARSKEYHINLVEHCCGHATACFKFLSNFEWPIDLNFTAPTAMSYFIDNHPSLVLTESLYHAMRKFSISRIYGLALNKPPVVYDLAFNKQLIRLAPISPFLSLTIQFIAALFKFLQKSDSAKHLELYQYHQSEYDHFLRERMKLYSPKSPIPLFFALVAIYRKIPIVTFHHQFNLFDKSHFDEEALDIFRPQSVTVYHMGYLEYLSDFLQDPRRSREFCAGRKLFAQAAKYCLLYLCDHTALGQKAPPRTSARQRMRRKRAPWKWLRRVPREDIRGSLVTPWFWLRRPTYDGLSNICILHRKTNNHIYVHSPHFDIGFPDCDDPVVMYRLNSEKYRLALSYLNYFLPRAAKMDDLVLMCQRLTFASLSRDFPQESAKARSKMQIYAVQWR